MERHVALEHTGGRGDGDVAGGGACGNCGCKKCVGPDSEVCENPIKGDLCCSLESLAKDLRRSGQL